MLVTLLFMLIFYLSVLPWASSLLRLRYLSSLARDFSNSSLYITISTSVTSGGLAAIMRSSQNLPFADGLPFRAFAPSMTTLRLLYPSIRVFFSVIK